MIAYHGSNSNFKKFRIHKDLVKSDSTLRNEGLGIYFSTNIDVAKSYGKYLYTIGINDKVLLDFTNKRVCTSLIYNVCKEVYKSTGADISCALDVNDIADYLHTGRVAISGLHREIWLLLDSNEEFYKRYSDSQRERICTALKLANKKALKAYMFIYQIPNIGVIKDASDDVVRILKKERIR